VPGATKPRDYFATTLWTVVIEAAHCDNTRAREALAQLCQTYWFPLYAYVRRRGYSPEDAEDLTQGFFARLLELNSLAAVRREKGKFRSFLLASLNHYLSDEWDRARAQKRGHGRVVSLDGAEAETRLSHEPATHDTPERLFEKQWAVTLLESVVRRLQAEHDDAGKGELFLALRFAIVGDKSDVPYSQLAAQTGLTEEALRVTVHRLRRRYRELLRDEIARTVATPGEVEEELRHLFKVLTATE
jgi:RNA polymerase sigma-70 factor (ECF subfamily)